MNLLKGAINVYGGLRHTETACAAYENKLNTQIKGLSLRKTSPHYNV